MKKLLLLVIVLLTLSVVTNADIKVTAIRGNVYARHNVQEKWNRVAVGDILKPEDSMKLDKKSSATIMIDEKNKLVVPELVIVDLSDFRMLSQEDLLLKLAMERVRSLPPEQGNDELQVQKTTTMHGEPKAEESIVLTDDMPSAILQLNGTKVLYSKGFYATCALKTKEILRLHPKLLSDMSARIMVAGSLEAMKLYGEALSEYLSIPSSELSAKQVALVKGKIEGLRKSKH